MAEKKLYKVYWLTFTVIDAGHGETHQSSLMFRARNDELAVKRADKILGSWKEYLLTASLQKGTARRVLKEEWKDFSPTVTLPIPVA